MRNFYFIIFLILFIQCEKPSNKSTKDWNKKDEIKSDVTFKDIKINVAIEQAFFIAESNQIPIKSISLFFAKEKFYLFISSADEDCTLGNYYSLPITIQNIDYTLLLDKNELLEKNIDISNLRFTPLNLTKISFCCEIKGYAYRFNKDEKGNYQLRNLVHFYDFTNDFILKEDKKYFPIQYEEIPEPEN